MLTKSVDNMSAKAIDKRKIIISLITVGLSSVITQLVMIREAISTFGGNELVIGLTMGFWLLANACGAALGIWLNRKKKSKYLLSSAHMILAILPFLQIIGFRALPFLGVRGELLGLGSVIFGSSLILLPYGLVSGAMIPTAAGLLSISDATASVYRTEITGYIIGGILFSLVFVNLLSHWLMLVVIGFLNLLIAFILSSPQLYPLPLILALIMIISLPLNLTTLSWQTPGQKILIHRNTSFSQLTITQSGQQLNVLSDGIPLFSTHDYRAEAISHIPLSQIEEGAKVLLISGGVFGTLREILKHKPDRIDYVEIDPAILEMDRQIDGILDNPIIHTHIGDGRLFIKEAHNKGLKYDCLILDLPDPENIQLNRFYTREFFQEAQHILNQDGVLFFTLSGADNYLGPEALALNRAVYEALHQVFAHITIFPGETHYFLASPKPLSDIRKMAQELAKRNITTEWLVDYHLPEISDPFKMDQVRSLVTETESLPNTDQSPRAFRHLLNLWLKKSGSLTWLIPIILFLTILFALFAYQGDRLRFVTLSSGYAGISLELSLVVLFQIVFGYVYLWISLFVTLFMAGSILGAIIGQRWKKSLSQQIIRLDLALVLLAVLVFLITIFSGRFQNTITLLFLQYLIIPFLTFSSGLIVGWQFVAVSHQLKGNASTVTGRLYLADLAGASCGTMFISLFLLPGFGLTGVLFSVILIKSINLIMNF